ncbi:hypothetical protein, partial [Chryseosolibacter indicus]
MKKVLLLIPCLFLCNLLLAQEYEMNVEIDIMTSANDVKCSSHFLLMFVLQNGETWEWRQGLSMSKNSWANYKKTFSYKASNPVVQIKCISQRYTENLVDCKHQDGGENIISDFSRNLCLGEQVWYGTFKGYHEASSLKVNVKPLSLSSGQNLSAVQIDTRIQLPFTVLRLDYSVSLRFTNGLTSQVLDRNSESYSNGTISNYQELAFIPFPYKVSKVIVKLSVSKSLFNSDSFEKIYDVEGDGSEVDLYLDSDDSPFPPLGASSYVHVRYGKPKTPLFQN